MDSKETFKNLEPMLKPPSGMNMNRRMILNCPWLFAEEESGKELDDDDTVSLFKTMVHRDIKSIIKLMLRQKETLEHYKNNDKQFTGCQAVFLATIPLYRISKPLSFPGNQEVIFYTMSREYEELMRKIFPGVHLYDNIWDSSKFCIDMNNLDQIVGNYYLFFGQEDQNLFSKLTVIKYEDPESLEKLKRILEINLVLEKIDEFLSNFKKPSGPGEKVIMSQFLSRGL